MNTLRLVGVILGIIGLVCVFVAIAIIVGIVTLYLLHGFGLVLGHGHGHMVTPRELYWPNVGN